MEHVEKTANDYKKYFEQDLNLLLNPVNKSINDMLSRLQDLDIMMSFLVQDRKDYKDILTSIPSYKPEFDDLCNKIDSMEKLMSHIKCNLDALEDRMEKTETDLGCAEKTAKVTQIFTPLFKKSMDKKQQEHHEIFKTEDYFK